MPDSNTNDEFTQTDDNLSTDNQSTDNQSTTNQSTTNQPTDNQPTTNQPTTNQPTTDNQSSTNQPTDNQPTTNQSIDNQPTHIVNETIVDTGLIVTNQQSIDTAGNIKTETTFNTTNDNVNNAHIKQNLVETVTNDYDNTNNSILLQIKDYAGKIKCEDFHGKGTIDDYNELFVAASKIANDTKQMKLDVDVDGFDEFGRAADELSELFASFTKKIQNINIINDSTFLQSVLNALVKIYNLSETFGKFKETILVTSSIKIPKSAHETNVVMQGVMDELSCAMNYINHFVSPDTEMTKANLTDVDKNIIKKAVQTIDNWKVLCDEGVSIALTNNTDIQSIKNINSSLKQKTSALKNATSALRTKMNLFKN
jgi:hypothetical protein